MSLKPSQNMTPSRDLTEKVEAIRSMEEQSLNLLITDHLLFPLRLHIQILNHLGIKSKLDHIVTSYSLKKQWKTLLSRITTKTKFSNRTTKIWHLDIKVMKRTIKQKISRTKTKKLTVNNFIKMLTKVRFLFFRKMRSCKKKPIKVELLILVLMYFKMMV